MASYSINKLNFTSVPTGNQTVRLEYKLWSQPSSSYVLISGSVSVAPNGNILTSPLPLITGLTSGQTYNVRASTTCRSPLEYWVENIIAP